MYACQHAEVQLSNDSHANELCMHVPPAPSVLAVTFRYGMDSHHPRACWVGGPRPAAAQGRTLTLPTVTACHNGISDTSFRCSLQMRTYGSPRGTRLRSKKSDP